MSSLRDSFALHLSATRAEKTARIYLAALGGPRTSKRVSAAARLQLRPTIEQPFDIIWRGATGFIRAALCLGAVRWARQHRSSVSTMPRGISVMAGVDRSDRALRGRIGAYRLHATHDSRETSKPAGWPSWLPSNASSTRTEVCRRRNALGERHMLDRRISRSSPTCRRRPDGSARLAGEAIDQLHDSHPAGPGGTGRVSLDGAARARPSTPALDGAGRRCHGRAGGAPVVRPSSDRPAPAQAAGRMRPADGLLGCQSAATARSVCLRLGEAGEDPARAVRVAVGPVIVRGDRDGLAGHPPARDA